MESISAQALYKTAAVVYGLSVPGHFAMGFQLVYPALRKIPYVGDNAKGRMGAEGCWNFTGAVLFYLACLNWQWARTGGPQSIEESLILWINAAVQIVNAVRYAQAGVYITLGPLLMAPLLTVVASRM